MEANTRHPRRTHPRRLLLAAAVLLAGCSDSETASPSTPAQSEPPAEAVLDLACTGVEQSQEQLDETEAPPASSFDEAVEAFEDTTPLLRNVAFERQRVGDLGRVHYFAPDQPDAVQLRLSVVERSGEWRAQSIIICPTS